MSTRKDILRKRVRFLRRLRKLTFLVIILTLFYMGGKFIFASTYNVITQSSLVSLKQPVSFLFIGSDNGGESRNLDSDWQPLADAIILTTINPNNSRGNVEVNTISIPRDTQANIACANNQETGEPIVDKINSSFAYGYEQDKSLDDATDCTVKTVQNMFDIKIDYHIQTSFDGVINLVDRIGGVDIDVPYAFCEQDSEGNANSICLKKGQQTLNGEQSLAYARQRKATNPETGVSGDDFERNIRQQEIITSIVNKIISDPTSNVDALTNTLLNDMQTNLGAGDIVQFVNFGVNFYNAIVESLNGGNKLDVYIKNSAYSRVIAINPYEDLFNVNFEDIKPQTLAEINPDLVDDENQLYMDGTYAYPLRVTYQNFKFPRESTLKSDNNFAVELQMETLKTEQDSFGTTQEVPMDGVIDYYTQVFNNALKKK